MVDFESLMSSSIVTSGTFAFDCSVSCFLRLWKVVGSVFAALGSVGYGGTSSDCAGVCCLFGIGVSTCLFVGFTVRCLFGICWGVSTSKFSSGCCGMPCTSLGTLVTEIDSWKTGPLSSALAVSFEVTKSSRAELDLFVGGAVSFV